MKSYSDIHKIENKINDLKKSVDPSKRWWPETLFHFTDVHNAVNILKSGKLFSRKYLLDNGGMKNDNASPEIIGLTNDEWKNYVRFYFRPRTPTQYHNEGFRPKNQRTLGGAHCPVPIFFLFESLPILSMKESKFSTGNLAANYPVYNTGRDFEEMPFNYIYHEGSFDRYTESYITSHRQAEVIVPNYCTLDHLRLIVCRSSAERETLIDLLPYDTYQKFRHKIVVDTRLNLFNSDWMYIDRVTMTKEEIVFSFNQGSRVVSPFKAYFEIIENKTNRLSVWGDDNFLKKPNFTMSITNLNHTEDYKIKFYLEDELAYSNSYLDDDLLPF